MIIRSRCGYSPTIEAIELNADCIVRMMKYASSASGLSSKIVHLYYTTAWIKSGEDDHAAAAIVGILLVDAVLVVAAFPYPGRRTLRVAASSIVLDW